LLKPGGPTELPADDEDIVDTPTPFKLQTTYAVRKGSRSEEHTSELQSLRHLVCRLLLEKKKDLMTRKITGKLSSGQPGCLDRLFCPSRGRRTPGIETANPPGERGRWSVCSAAPTCTSAT